MSKEFLTEPQAALGLWGRSSAGGASADLSSGNSQRWAGGFCMKV